MLERQTLEKMLADGFSLEKIGRALGKHPSTVSYWMRKYGLKAVHHERHQPRGSLDRDELIALIARNLSVREIAAATERSVGTVRHWLREYGLETTAAARAKRPRPATGAKEPGVCAIHGEVLFAVRRDGTRVCMRCRGDAVTRRRQRVKRILVEEFGGACTLCGYRDCIAALQFHHLDPSTKSFGLGSRGLARALEKVRAEAQKCVLLCANCHVEVEMGVRSLGD